MNIYQEVSVPQSKTCNICKKSKLVEEFSRMKKSADGRQSKCKFCANISNKEYHLNNNTILTKETKRIYDKTYRTEYQQTNKGMINAKNAKRRATQFNATPEWANLDEIKKLYDTSVEISLISGIQHHVDHIVPLQSEIVCGLHCIANLQIISSSENYSKSNRHWPDMPTVLIV